MATRSFWVRSLVAAGLMVGFYVLALAIAGSLIAIPLAEVVYTDRVHIKLALMCVLGAGTILWSILPRRDVFPDPGPKLTADHHPELFRSLERAAFAVGQEMPADVFLVSDMNAWVANRGGTMGFGSRRIMGLGLPLLRTVSVPELEAILAHEFGHYHGGDTRLGPWIYKTRSAIGRTLEGLGNEGILQAPFRWYGNVFLRITQAISRAQELTADRLAATTIGSAPLISGLKKVHAYAPAFDAYWRNEAAPVLDAGFHAPLAAGFAAFLRVPRIEAAVHKGIEQQLESGSADPYDSHPALAERIAALEPAAQQEALCAVTEDSAATALLNDVTSCEQALIRHMAGAQHQFESVPWDDVTGRVFVPQWRARAERMADIFGACPLRDLPRVLLERRDALTEAEVGPDRFVPSEAMPQVLGLPIGAYVMAALLDAGWTASAGLGEPATVRCGDTILEPFAIGHRLVASDTADMGWWEDLMRAPDVANARVRTSSG